MEKKRFNQNWYFWKDGCEHQKQAVILPHDAMILEDRQPDMENGSASGYFPGGKYWYSKTFFGGEEFRDQTAVLEFEGVYMNATVWLNREKVGGWIYGYTNFLVDITDRIRLGEENTLLVCADNSMQPNARWYTGSGIYRPVNLWIGGKCHIAPLGLRVKTVSVDPAVIEVAVQLENAGPETNVEYEIWDADRCVATARGSNAQILVPEARLWTAETPNLYQIRAKVTENGVVTDRAQSRFGIRILGWDPKNGLTLNGKTVKLRGGCIHHDNGILGACAYDEAEYRKIKKLREFGFNAIRFSHYPAGQNLLDVCDKLGMYVMDESFDQWLMRKSRYDYSTCFVQESIKDITALAVKDYNHPSVILYCIGNEIPETGCARGVQVAGELMDTIKSIDDTRPVTIANNAFISAVAARAADLQKKDGESFGSQEFNELITSNADALIAMGPIEMTPQLLEQLLGPVYDQVDIAGFNYGNEHYEYVHTANPDRILLSAETLPSQMASNWKDVVENDHIIGDFHWTAWDYLGETGVGLPVYGTTEAPFAKPYPCLTAACGSFDLSGNPLAPAYYTAALWGKLEKPYIGVRPVDHSGEPYTLGRWQLTDVFDSWTWPGCEGKTAQITVYNNGVEAELLLNGMSLGRKPLIDCKAEFETVYAPGTLEAISYDALGAEQGRNILETAGEDIQLQVLPEETVVPADPERVVFVPIWLVDKAGRVNPSLARRVYVTVSGPGSLIALGSANPVTEEPFYLDNCTTYRGRLLAVIRCSGEAGTIHITVKMDEQEGVAQIICQ